MRKCTRLFLIVLFVSTAFSAWGQLYPTRTFSEEQGLNCKFVFSIAQDTNGVLLLATEKGVTTFNGDHFHSCASNHSAPEVQVSDVFTDSRGMTWLGHFQKGLRSVQNGAVVTLDSGSLLKGRIHSLSEDKSGYIWGISTGVGVFSVHPMTGQPLVVDSSGLAQSIYTLDHWLLEGTDHGILVRHSANGEAGQQTQVLNEMGAYSVTTMTSGIVHGKHYLFAAVPGDGIYTYEYANDRFRFHGFIGRELNLQYADISSLLMMEDGSLWIASIGEGLRKVEFSENAMPMHTEQVTETEGLVTNDIKYMFADAEQNIWLGTYGIGLIEIPHSVFRFYNQSNGLIRTEVNCVTLDSTGVLWLGTNSGLTRFCPGNMGSSDPALKTVHFDKRNGFHDAIVTCLLTDADDFIWIGTQAHGLFRMDPRNNMFENMSVRSTVPLHTVNSLTSTQSGEVIAGTTDGAFVYDRFTGNVQYLTTMEGLLHNNVRHLFTDHTNSTWFSSEATPPYVRHNGNIHVIHQFESRTQIVVSGVTEDTAKTRWIATAGDGIFSFDGKESKQYTVANGLRSDHCLAAVSDRNGVLWAVHRNGLSLKFPEDTLFRVYAVADNQLLRELNGQTYHAENGSIYLCSDNGLVEIPPSSKGRLIQYPRVSLNKVFVNGKEIAATEEVKLSAGTYNISLDFNSILLSSTGPNPFYYRISGEDSSWNLSVTNTILIPQLSSGEYMIQVTGEDPQRMKKPPLNLRITIDYPFWQQTWFIVTALSLLPFLFLGGVRLRTLQLTNRNAQLAVLVKRKTELLQAEKESVARMNKELQQKTKDITDSIQYAMRIQMATLPDTSIFSRAFPESFLFYKPRDIVSGDFYWFAQKGDLFFIAVADCTGHGVPGAFMSMIGCTLMNKVVFDYRVDLPSGILDILNREIKMALHQEEGTLSTHDGMDIALCVIDRKKEVLHFSGAGRPLVVIRGTDITVHKTNKGGLGGVYSNKLQLFDEVVIPYRKGDMFYMYTDGYPDQFGFGDRFKFTSPSFRKLLVSLADDPAQEQCQMLEDTFNRWKGEAQQCDDVLVAGFRIT